MYSTNVLDWGIAHYGLFVKCSTQKLALEQITDKSCFEYWSCLGDSFGVDKVFIQFPECPVLIGESIAGYVIPAKSYSCYNTAGDTTMNLEMYEEEIVFNTLYSNQLPLTKNIRKAVDMIAENNDRYFLHCMDERTLLNTAQIAISGNCANLIVGATITEALNRKRSDYCLSNDIPLVVQQLKRLDPGNFSKCIDVSFRMFSPVTKGNWRFNISECRIVERFNGLVYVLSKNIDCYPISDPLIAR